MENTGTTKNPEKKQNNLPTEPGLYWVRNRDYKWYNLIFEVYGDSPFLKARAWDRANDRVIEIKSPLGYIWGPKIEEPEVKDE